LCAVTSDSYYIFMEKPTQRAIVVAGPTASGKTTLGVQLASLLDGEIISADSRQVYRGLDIGSGKDLEEYTLAGRTIPYHLIDITDLSTEYSVFHYQQAFYGVYEDICRRGRLPLIVGGTGMYLEAALSAYQLQPTPRNDALREELAVLDDDSLAARLAAARPNLHNETDLVDRARLLRAIEIAEYARDHPPLPAPQIRTLNLVIMYPPALLRERIARRLRERLAGGLIEEVEALHDQGFSWERLQSLGLEYRYTSEYLQGIIKTRNDLFQKLNSAIAQFAKRQRTWFRGMERRGFIIHWLPGADLSAALKIIREEPL